MGLHVNYMWVAVVLVNLYVHIKNIRLFGFVNDPMMKQFEPNLASTIFVLTISLMIADNPLSLRYLRRRHVVFEYIFESMMAMVITNIAIMFFWIPLLHLIDIVVESVFEFLLTVCYCSGLGVLGLLVRFLEYESSRDCIASMLAFLFLIFYLQANDYICMFNNYWNKFLDGRWCTKGGHLRGCCHHCQPTRAPSSPCVGDESMVYCDIAEDDYDDDTCHCDDPRTLKGSIKSFIRNLRF